MQRRVEPEWLDELPAEDPRAFYAALRTLALNRERREEMARAANTYARRLTYSATAGPLRQASSRPACFSRAAFRCRSFTWP